MKTQIDCISSGNIVRLPGLIDVHVHLRQPGAEYKEDFDSGTSAALAGGVTMVLCMPNTKPAIVDQQSFQMAHQVRLKFELSSVYFCADCGLDTLMLNRL